MKKALIVSFALMTGFTLAPSGVNADEILCMECHEPADDWEGMSAKEILAEAMDKENAQHEDNAAFSKEQLETMIATLLAK